MNLELDEHEQAILIGLLVEVIETSTLPTSLRLKSAKSILAKLGVGSAVTMPTQHRTGSRGQTAS